MADITQPHKFGFQIFAGFGVGFVLVGSVLHLMGWGLFADLVVVAGFACIAVGIAFYFVTLFLANPAADGLLAFLTPSGRSTPMAKGYSQIEALVAQSRFAEAAQAYTDEIEQDPNDVEAMHKLARLYLTHLDRPQEAAMFLAKARDGARTDSAKLGYSVQLVELYRIRLKETGRAMVELRRLIDTFPGTPQAKAARRELKELLEASGESSV